LGGRNGKYPPGIEQTFIFPGCTKHLHAGEGTLVLSDLLHILVARKNFLDTLFAKMEAGKFRRRLIFVDL